MHAAHQLFQSVATLVNQPKPVTSRTQNYPSLGSTSFLFWLWDISLWFETKNVFNGFNFGPFFSESERTNERVPPSPRFYHCHFLLQKQGMHVFSTRTHSPRNQEFASPFLCGEPGSVETQSNCRCYFLPFRIAPSWFSAVFLFCWGTKRPRQPPFHF